MSNEENKESVIASYELTAAHKEDDDISESEVNDMINESEEGTVPSVEHTGKARGILHFLYKNLLWFIICIAIFVICIIASNLYFRIQDRKTLNSVSSHEISPNNLDVTNKLTLLEKINIINGECYYTDLNFDYTDKHSYSEIHDITVNELTSYFSDYFSCDFTVNGIYEMYISKYLATSDEDSYRSFTIWVVNICYFGFEMNCFLDYDTNKLITFTMNLDPNSNTFYSEGSLVELEYYNDYILPLYNFLGSHVGNSTTFSDTCFDTLYDILASYYELSFEKGSGSGAGMTPTKIPDSDLQLFEKLTGTPLTAHTYYTYTTEITMELDVDTTEEYNFYMKNGLFFYQMNRYFYN